MSFLHRAETGLDYSPCRYGGSKLLFRGPRRRVEAGYLAVLGGSETYGRFVERPYPALVEHATGRKTVNLGYVNAGIDVFLQDEAVMGLAAGAEVAVVQLLGAQNLSNRFYTVHPRRNDRFVAASTFLQTLYRDVDFTEFNFTRHLLVALERQAPERFALVVEELQEAWLGRMRRLIAAVGGKTVLLWIGEAPPADGGRPDANAPDPLFVTRAMIDALRPEVASVVEVVESTAARAAGTSGMVFSSEEEAAARTATSAAVHAQVGRALAENLAPLLV